MSRWRHATSCSNQNAIRWDGCYVDADICGCAAVEVSDIEYWEHHRQARRASPYPEFCRYPDQCRGQGCCPLDPCCAD
jgi:hypothetical protein